MLIPEALILKVACLCSDSFIPFEKSCKIQIVQHIFSINIKANLKKKKNTLTL